MKGWGYEPLFNRWPDLPGQIASWLELPPSTRPSRLRALMHPHAWPAHDWVRFLDVSPVSIGSLCEHSTVAFSGRQWKLGSTLICVNGGRRCQQESQPSGGGFLWDLDDIAAS